MKLWIVFTLFALSAFRYDSPFAGLMKSDNPYTVVGIRSGSSMLCSAEESVFMGFGGKQQSDERNIPKDDQIESVSNMGVDAVEDIDRINALRGLPNPSDHDPSDVVRSLTVNGDALKLDELGPIIVNADGTLRRIENWATLTKNEQAATFKIITRRNQKRLTALKELQREQDAALATAETESEL